METLHGIVERVTFHAEDTGYSVLKVKVYARSEPVTVTCRVASITLGEEIKAQGEWVNVADYGRQFKSEVIETAAPSSREGIERYLGSGLIEGIGPVYAKKLVERFGEGIFDIIEQNSAKLEEVPGVGSKRRKEIKASWEKHKSIRQIMVFLHRHGISTGKAVKIFQTYGENAIGIVQGNPWQLAKDINGIGFKSADRIAQQLGMAADAPERLRAALTHLLLAAGDDGHCALPRGELLTKGVELLQTRPELVEEALLRMLESAEVVRELIDGAELIFPPHLIHAEREIAQRLRLLVAQPVKYPPIDAERAINWVQRETGRELAKGQRAAVEQALQSRILVITGGPGVGKTTILNSILRILGAKGVEFVLAAPTGRAARRMSESTGHEAKTIHRLLDYQPGTGWQRNRKSPLKGQLFVLDETSMVDAPLMHRWLDALPDHAHVLLTGDVDQLPSVGPGSVLADMIQCGLVPVARLTEVFRQAATSRIIMAAHEINSGLVPVLQKPAPKGCDFHFIERDGPEAIQETILHLARERIPEAFRLEPRDIQVLSPMNRTSLGTNNLNTLLQNALNPPSEVNFDVERFGLTFRTGDKVIQTRNNYDKDAFNGDTGRVCEIETDPLRLHVRFDDGRNAAYETGDLDELQLAYAITIHKSQGSEFPAVIIPVTTQHHIMMRRNLLYTGITRGRKLVVLVGDPKALALAVRDSGSSRRWSGLRERLGSKI